jgi:hypothetical protein
MNRSACVVVLMLGWSLPGRADPVQVTLGAEIGGGSVSLFGSRYSSLEAGIDVGAARWLSPNVGVGVTLGASAGVPMSPPHMDGHPLDRSVPWRLEPELLVRTTPAAWGRARVGWLATAGLGVASLHTDEECGGGGSLGDDEPSGHACVITRERSSAFTGSASGGGYLEAFHVAMFVGVRASANSGGDRATGLVANLGATF